MRGQFVLENNRGQVVRTFNWENDSMSLVYLKDTRRVEAVPSTKELDDQEIAYLELATVTQEQIKNKAHAVSDVGYLKWVDEIKSVTPSVITDEDNTEDLKSALKWVSLVQLGLLLLTFVIGHFVSLNESPEPQLVTVIPRPEIHKTKRAPIVEPTIKKEVVKNIQRPITPHKTNKVAQLRPSPKAARHQPQAIAHNSGALAILGSLEKANQQGGLNLGAMKTSRGVGLGGTQGSGGMQQSVYGAGLMGAPLGPQAKATGAGGYGTHGKGGGEAGYGKMSLVGSSNAYFQPVEQEASVEGGLDREEIAAVIQRHLGQVRFCYEQGLQVKSSLNGRVAIRFFINASGVVNVANISNTSLHASDVEGCIVSRLKSWKFPEPRGGVIVKVTYPFVLKRVSQS